MLPPHETKNVPDRDSSLQKIVKNVPDTKMCNILTLTDMFPVETTGLTAINWWFDGCEGM